MKNKKVKPGLMIPSGLVFSWPFRKDDGEWHCEFRVKIEGVPAKIKGNMRLQGTDQACINYVTLNVWCEVPLLGKKIARFLADDSHTKIEKEYRITRQLL